MQFSTIENIFSNGYFAIPDYQRDYEWGGEENDTLMDDIFAATDDQTGNIHFMGALVTVNYDPDSAVTKSVDIKKYKIPESQIHHVVDGQQRLTSMLIFISSLKELILESEYEFSKKLTEVAKRRFDNILLGTDYTDDMQVAPRLILNSDTGKCFNKEIAKTSEDLYDGRRKGARCILKAKEIYHKALIDKIRDLQESGYTQEDISQYFLKLTDAVCTRLRFVNIECDDSTDAFQVFDSLNGKGLDLTAADRIKNIFMSWGKRDRNAVFQWKELVEAIEEKYLTGFFIALFFYLDKKRISKNNLPNQFKLDFKSEASLDFTSFSNKLKKEAKLYGLIRRGEIGSSSAQEILQRLQRLKLEQIYAIIFAVALGYGENVLRTKEFTDFLTVLTKLIVRMQVCEKSMNTLDVLFSECIIMIHDKKDISEITGKINSKRILISDDTFRKAFTDFAPSDNEVSLFYLAAIEDFLRVQKGNRNSVYMINPSVEHIIPQKVNLDEWYSEFPAAEPLPDYVLESQKELIIERIGNKALLFTDDNSSAKNNNFSIKLKIYKNGKNGQSAGTPENTFELIADIVANYGKSFVYEDVCKRAAELADIATKIW